MIVQIVHFVRHMATQEFFAILQQGSQLINYVLFFVQFVKCHK
jgi:hypothetical protein